MQRDAWRAYLGLALGLTEQSRKKATQVAKAMVGRSGATAEQMQTVAEELLRVGSANRDAIVQVVRAELDGALQRVGLVRADEVEQLNARVQELELQLRRAEQAAGRPAPGEPAEAAAQAVGTETAEPATPTVVKKTAKKAVKKAAATPPASTTDETPATVAKKVGKKAVAKKAPAKKVAKKAAPGAEPEGEAPGGTAAKKATIVKKTTQGQVQP